VTSLLLAPVRKRLEQVAKFDVPLLIAEESGTGKRAAVCAWGQARFGDDVILDFVASDTLDVGSLEILIEDPVRPGRGCQPRRAQTVIVLTDVDLLSPHVQRRLARGLDDGFVPIAATTRRTSEQLRGSSYLDHGLLHRPAVAPVSMPPLRARRTDIPALAECLLRRAERRHGVEVRPIAEDARRELAARDLPGNLIELNALMTAALIRGGAGVPIDADLIRGLSTPFLSAAQAIQDNAIAAEVLRDLSSGPLSLNVVNSQLYRQAMQRCNGTSPPLGACWASHELSLPTGSNRPRRRCERRSALCRRQISCEANSYRVVLNARQARRSETDEQASEEVCLR
jgi:transcriptional regulator of acetoin/glycerol metabolism